MAADLAVAVASVEAVRAVDPVEPASAADDAKLFERAVAQIPDAPLEEENENRSRYQEGEEKPEEEPSGKAPAGIEPDLQPRQELHAVSRMGESQVCIGKELL